MKDREMRLDNPRVAVGKELLMAMGNKLLMAVGVLSIKALGVVHVELRMVVLMDDGPWMVYWHSHNVL